MRYSKPPLTFEAQADLLMGRGMAGDRALIIQRLAAVNYYRLSGYWYPYRTTDDTFRAGTCFDDVWDRYVFDRHLRLLVMDAIGHIEIGLRTRLAYHHAHEFGPFGYADDARSLPGLDPRKRQAFLERVRDEVERSKERFVEHFRDRYGDEHRDLPIWMLAEVLSFGSALTMLKACPKPVADKVAEAFHLPARVLVSWLLCLNAVRNICAHHGRLWNRVLGVKPMIPRAYTHPEWSTPKPVPNDRVFVVLTMCRFCLQHLGTLGRWSERVRALLTDWPSIPRPDMGFPPEWETSALWAEGRPA